MSIASDAGAQDVPAGLAETVERATDGQARIEAIRNTPIPGLFEVTTKDTDLFYVDRSGRYGLVDGRLVDMRERKDLTAERLAELRSIDFSKLPLRLAIKRGNGKRVLAVFEDPTCPVCRSLHKFISQIPDTTVYHFPFPVTTPEAMPIAAAAWCASDRAQAWEHAMLDGATAPLQPPSCDTTGLRQIIQAGDALRVNGTPTVFLTNGRRLQGAVPPDAFLAALEDSARDSRARPGER